MIHSMINLFLQLFDFQRVSRYLKIVLWYLHRKARFINPRQSFFPFSYFFKSFYKDYNYFLGSKNGLYNEKYHGNLSTNRHIFISKLVRNTNNGINESGSHVLNHESEIKNIIKLRILLPTVFKNISHLHSGVWYFSVI